MTPNGRVFVRQISTYGITEVTAKCNLSTGTCIARSLMLATAFIKHAFLAAGGIAVALIDPGIGDACRIVVGVPIFLC